MGIDALLMRLESRGKGAGRRPATSDTPAPIQTYQREPAPLVACTPATSDTSGIVDGTNRAANDADRATTPTQAQAAELSVLVPEVCGLVGEADIDTCLAAALADPDGALTCYRALEADFERAALQDEANDADPRMRPCRRCGNLAYDGWCRAAARGEPFGHGVATSRSYVPGEPDRPQRCGAYKPLPDDPDQRTGQERWPFLFHPPLTPEQAWGNRDGSTTPIFRGRRDG